MFRTELEPAESVFKISLETPIFTIGSCFAQVIGQRLSDCKFTVSNNPFGVIYNPASIVRLLDYSIDQASPAPDSYDQRDDINFNYHLHSSFSSLDGVALTSQIEEEIGRAHRFLKESKWLMVSLGTAWVYSRKGTDEVVANCHKMPSEQFEKRLLTRKEILGDFNDLFQKLGDICPDLRVILTVSPIRHLRDTLELNQVSKSTLRLACFTLEQEFEQVQYFPSYEIMMDDLRDYRFYSDDMIHPSHKAEEYIWKKFSHAYLDSKALEFVATWSRLRSSLSHRPFHPDSASHQRFLKSTLKQLENLEYPVDVTAEMESIRQQMTTGE